MWLLIHASERGPNDEEEHDMDLDMCYYRRWLAITFGCKLSDHIKSCPCPDRMMYWGMYYSSNSVSNSRLIDRNVQTWLLTGWQKATSQPEARFDNSRYLIRILMWDFSVMNVPAVAADGHTTALAKRSCFTWVTHHLSPVIVWRFIVA